MERKALNTPAQMPETQILSNSEAQTWKPLQQFNYYRVILSLALLLFFHNAFFDGLFGKNQPEWFLAINILFLFSSLIYIFIGSIKIPSFYIQSIVSNGSDILFIILMMHFSGGLSSGLGILLIVNIAATGTFLHRREALLFASLASLGILAQQTFSFFQNISDVNSYSTAGILGIAFFASSLLASILNQRVRETEALANQRAADLVSLEKLNDHIIQNMRTGILVVDNQGQIRMANSSAESLLGEISLTDNPQLKNILPALDTRFHEWQE